MSVEREIECHSPPSTDQKLSPSSPVHRQKLSSVPAGPRRSAQSELMSDPAPTRQPPGGHEETANQVKCGEDW
jgi:hypothetical protein